MTPVRRGDGTGLDPKGYTEVRKGDGTVLYSSVATEGLIGYWPCDEGSGDTIYDDSTEYGDDTAYDGILNGANFTSDISGDNIDPDNWDYTISYDGTDDYAEIGSGPNLSGESSFTVCGWFLTDDPSTQQAVMSASREKDDMWDLRYNDTEFIFALKTTDRTLISGGVTINKNEWYHIAATYDGSEMKLYKDGSEIDNTSKSGDVVSKSHDVIFGAFDKDGRIHFSGRGTHQRIYAGNALSESEIQKLYDNRV